MLGLYVMARTYLLENMIKIPNSSDKFINDELGDLVYIMKL